MPEQLKVLDLFSGIVSADSHSASNEPECEPSRSAKSIHMHEQFLRNDGVQSGLPQQGTQPQPTSKTFVDESMSSPQDSLARMSVVSENELGCQAPDLRYGDTLCAPWQKFDLDMLSWRTAQLCLIPDLVKFSGPWPRSGTMRSGIAFRLPTLARAITETDCGSWVIYPTPRAQGSSNAGGSNAKKAALKNGVYVTGSLNPCHQERLMGFDTGHTEIESSATPSSPKSPKSSAARSSQQKKQSRSRADD